MKRLFCVFLAVIFPLIIVGCSGGGCASKPTTVALNTSKITHVGVAAGIRTWDSYIKQQVAEIAVSETLTNAADIKATKERKAKLVKEAKQVRDAYEAYRLAQIASIEIAAQLASVPADSTNAPAAQDQLDKSRASVKAALDKVGVLLIERDIPLK